MSSATLPASLQVGDLAPHVLTEAVTLPACAYTDPDFHAFDLAHIFARSWQLVGRAGDVREAGDYLVADIAGRPVILVRGHDGVLRGFFNVCKHRAGPLALVNGHEQHLHCKYHGWTYTLDGRLHAATEMQEAACFNPTGIRLDPVNAGEWEGLVFASVREPAMTLEQLMHGIRERIRPIDLPSMRFHARIVYDIACNWKVYVDNYLEGYHLPYVHPGLNRLLDYRTYATVTAEWYSYQHSPLDGANGPYRTGQAQYYLVYPNITLNVLPGRLQTNLVLPVSQRQCRVIFDYFYADTGSAGARREIEEDMKFADEVQREDIDMCERVQIGLESGAYHAGRLSPKRESGVHHFHELVRGSYREAAGLA
jgi:phenylpropionate dioxygenase-like ring-hydroxylating dioxygenase large terminal subunit